MFKPLKEAPVDTSDWSDEQSFRVWAHSPPYMEDPLPWKCVAAFRFLQDSLHYIADLQDAGVDCVFQSPAHTDLIKATDRRVVCKPRAEELIPA